MSPFTEVTNGSHQRAAELIIKVGAVVAKLELQRRVLEHIVIAIFEVYGDLSEDEAAVATYRLLARQLKPEIATAELFGELCETAEQFAESSEKS